MTSTQRSQTIHAPSEEPIPPHHKTVFLAGTTTAVDAAPDWRETLSASLSPHPVTIFNPHRPDWDATWREDIAFPPYREQVQWELSRQRAADLVVVYFHPATLAPVSLLELGLWARVPGKVVAVAPEGYRKRGNVQMVCREFGVRFLERVEEVYGVVVERLGLE
ncbi:uncharacterized protein GGS25DRAFT_520031 [Hypoxylon fragiforme]|uniref:uncharacterized protein n=1 Tax=Hypoxylon fragiforme TaxID=63214 RepID=UPI0020C6415C|nr:uncharacterized protein GGS25DRAFT_520031 [Hypoxylon fragiforme]KAI2611720.1 hypothetical protein GGS25DRAFT_520031 [Hypoxylon fragiforme]